MEMSLTERLVALSAIVVLVAVIVGYHWLTGRRSRRKVAGAPAASEARRDQAR